MYNYGTQYILLNPFHFNLEDRFANKIAFVLLLYDTVSHLPLQHTPSTH